MSKATKPDLLNELRDWVREQETYGSGRFVMPEAATLFGDPERFNHPNYCWEDALRDVFGRDAEPDAAVYDVDMIRATPALLAACEALVAKFWGVHRAGWCDLCRSQHALTDTAQCPVNIALEAIAQAKGGK